MHVGLIGFDVRYADVVFDPDGVNKQHLQVGSEFPGHVSNHASYFYQRFKRCNGTPL